MTIYLVRHTAYQNPDNIIACHLPLELSQEGTKHAHQIGEFFQNRQIQQIYTSPIKRAMQTAQIFSQHLRIPINSDARFTEINNPTYQGTKRQLSGKCLYTLPGGETEDQIFARMNSGVNDLLKIRKKTLVVSHGDPITILLYRLLGQTTPQLAVRGDNCYIRKGEIIKLEFDPAGKLINWESLDVKDNPD